MYVLWYGTPEIRSNTIMLAETASNIFRHISLHKILLANLPGSYLLERTDGIAMCLLSNIISIDPDANILSSNLEKVAYSSLTLRQPSTFDA